MLLQWTACDTPLLFPVFIPALGLGCFLKEGFEIYGPNSFAPSHRHGGGALSPDGGDLLPHACVAFGPGADDHAPGRNAAGPGLCGGGPGKVWPGQAPGGAVLPVAEGNLSWGFRFFPALQ